MQQALVRAQALFLEARQTPADLGKVGFAGDLTIQVTTDFPPCVAPITRKLNVHETKVTENFSLPLVTTGHLRCQSFTGPGAPGSDSDRSPDPPDDPPPLADSGIQWQIATSDAILVDDANNVWNSGHINDILKRGPTEALVDRIKRFEPSASRRTP